LTVQKEIEISRRNIAWNLVDGLRIIDINGKKSWINYHIEILRN